MRYTHVFFDLDGTLLNTAPGIKHSFQYALRALEVPVLAEDELDFVIGPPLFWSFHDKLGYDEAIAERGVALYREYYRPTGMWECIPYEGIPALLQALHTAGVRLGVVTGKPEEFAVKLIRHFSLEHLFDFVVGTSFSDKHAEKKELLERAFTLAGLSGEARRGALMVGDRCFDIDGAKDVGIDSLGVLYGFGSREELEGHGATYVADSADAIRTLLLG